MPVQTLDICNIKGLHARASARFAEVVESYPKADATVRKDGMDTGGDSIMGLLMLGAGVGSVIEVETSGEDADALMTALAELVANKFGESD